MARVLWYGDVGAHTGFARVTHAIAPKLVEFGHDVHVLGVNYPGDWGEEWSSLKIYRGASKDPNDEGGTRRIAEIMAKVEPEVVVFLHDPVALFHLLFRNRWDPERLLLNYSPVIAYLPVDGDNYPISWTEAIASTTNVVAMSRHGQAVFPGSKLVYHGVDTDSFWPVSPERPVEGCTTKEECAEALGYDRDAFLIVRVDANSGRKDYASLIHALAPVLKKHDDIAVHLHAGLDPRMPGVLLQNMLERYDIENRVTVTDPMQGAWPTARVNLLLNAARLFVSTSRGEGFGLTIAEALAAGVPVVAQNVSAIPEVVGPGGILLDPAHRITTVHGHDQWLADVEVFTDAIEMLYQDSALRQELGHAGWVHVTQSFSWVYAAERFNDFVSQAARWRGSTEAH